MTGNNERKLPSVVIRYTLRSLLGLMLLACVFFAGRASLIPSLEAEKRRVMEARQATRAETEQAARATLEQLHSVQQDRIRRQWCWEYRRPFEEAEQHNVREMRKRIETEVQGTER